MERMKVTSGVDQLDSLLEGLYIGDNVVWYDDAGSLATVFYQNFIRRGMGESGADIFAHHAGDHQGPTHADRLAVWRPKCQGLENVILGAETAGKGNVRDEDPFGGQPQAEFTGKRRRCLAALFPHAVV